MTSLFWKLVMQACFRSLVLSIAEEVIHVVVLGALGLATVVPRFSTDTRSVGIEEMTTRRIKKNIMIVIMMIIIKLY